MNDNKYNIEFSEKILKQDYQRLINQMWKLIPMKENEENWQAQLATVIQEVAGLSKIFYQQTDFLILLSKLEGLDSNICENFMIFRKTVFRCIEILTRMVPNE